MRNSQKNEAASPSAAHFGMHNSRLAADVWQFAPAIARRKDILREGIDQPNRGQSLISPETRKDHLMITGGLARWLLIVLPLLSAVAFLNALPGIEDYRGSGTDLPGIRTKAPPMTMDGASGLPFTRPGMTRPQP